MCAQFSCLYIDHAGSNLGLWSVGVSPHRAVIGAADRTVNTVIIKYSNTLYRPWWAVKKNNY